MNPCCGLLLTAACPVLPRTRVLQFTSGGIDPWRPGAVLQTLDPTVPALTSAGASHCMDLRQANSNTLASVNATQAVIKAYIREWVYMPQREQH